MKLGIVIGHNSAAKGAYGVAPIDAYEFDYNSEIAEIMDDAAPEFGMDAKVFRRRGQGSYTREIREVYGKTDRWGAALTIELHFNAAPGPARGTETLSGPSSASLRSAHGVHRALVGLFDRRGVQDRGVKTYRQVRRGRLSLSTGRAPAILVEPFFGDHRHDAEQVQQLGQEALARAYLTGVADAWDLGAARVAEIEATDADFDLVHMR